MQCIEPSNDGANFRLMTVNDIGIVLSIQSEYYTGKFIEAEAVIRSRLLAFPDTTWVAEDEDGISAYLFGYRSLLGKVTPLGSLFTKYEKPNSLYLHDMVVSRRASGRGVGSGLTQMALDTARRCGLTYASLVAVLSAAGFWERFGFVETHLDQVSQRDTLQDYGNTARYMALVL